MRKAFVKCVRSVRKEFLSRIHEGKEYISVSKQAGETARKPTVYSYSTVSVVNVYILAHPPD